MGHYQDKTNLKKSMRKAIRAPLATVFFIFTLLLASSSGYTI